jgi:hypothetical protein
MIIEELSDRKIYFELICKQAENINIDNTIVFHFENSYYTIWVIPDKLGSFRHPTEYILAQSLNVSPYIQMKELSPQILLDAIYELIIRNVHQT